MTEVRKVEVVEQIKRWIVEHLPASSEATSSTGGDIAVSSMNSDGSFAIPILQAKADGGGQTKIQSQVPEQSQIHVRESAAISQSDHDNSLETKSRS